MQKYNAVIRMAGKVYQRTDMSYEALIHNLKLIEAEPGGIIHVQLSITK